MTAPVASPLLASTTAPAAPAGASDREKLTGVAKQFEAIFLRQMLASARKSAFADPLFSGQGMDTFRQMQDERFADIAADTGAFGLARMIEAHLARFVAAEAGQQEATGDGI
ncbi:MAG: rod-binding protein [Novosphingobium sp.]